MYYLGKRVTGTERDKLQREALSYLRRKLRRGARVYCVLRSVSRSGFTRWIDVYHWSKRGPVYITGYVARALDLRQQNRGGAVDVGGTGFDAAYYLGDRLSHALYDGPDFVRAEYL